MHAHEPAFRNLDLTISHPLSPLASEASRRQSFAECQGLATELARYGEHGTRAGVALLQYAVTDVPFDERDYDRLLTDYHAGGSRGVIAAVALNQLLRDAPTGNHSNLMHPFFSDLARQKEKSAAAFLVLEGLPSRYLVEAVSETLGSTWTKTTSPQTLSDTAEYLLYSNRPARSTMMLKSLQAHENNRCIKSFLFHAESLGSPELRKHKYINRCCATLLPESPRPGVRVIDSLIAEMFSTYKLKSLPAIGQLLALSPPTIDTTSKKRDASVALEQNAPINLRLLSALRWRSSAERFLDRETSPFVELFEKARDDKLVALVALKIEQSELVRQELSTMASADYQQTALFAAWSLGYGITQPPHPTIRSMNIPGESVSSGLRNPENFFQKAVVMNLARHNVQPEEILARYGTDVFPWEAASLNLALSRPKYDPAVSASCEGALRLTQSVCSYGIKAKAIRIASLLLGGFCTSVGAYMTHGYLLDAQTICECLYKKLDFRWHSRARSISKIEREKAWWDRHP